jgi:hypothetical protein
MHAIASGKIAQWLVALAMTSSVLNPPTDSLAPKALVGGSPAGQEDNFPHERKGGRLTPDMKTPLPVLIKRLEGRWKEVENGKDNWIGYTNDMYSIAARGDAAITPLIDFARSTTSDHARYGAILCLHLIGIERRIIGQHTEDFRNPRARQALLSLLSERSLQEPILRLLVRHPWPSDIPDLFKHLASDTPQAWAFVKALQRYGIRERPVHQEIPVATHALACPCKNNCDKKYATVVAALSKSLKSTLVVEPKLLQAEPLENQQASGKVLVPSISGGDVGSVLESLTGCTYASLGSQIEYYIEGKLIHLCSPATARKRWLDWYAIHRNDIKADIRRGP